MEIYRQLKENKEIVIALGFFDGMHQGHKKIIKTLVSKAKELGTKSAVITFDTNPSDCFSPVPTLNIQTFKDRELILQSLGVDYLYELDFVSIKEMSAEDYIKKVLVKYFKPKCIVVGYNHTFGKDKSGNAGLLQDESSKYGYEAVIVPEQKYDDKEEISSSIIRKRIQSGHLNAVKALLGRYFSIRNSVVQGDKMARALGYPTANIVWPESMVKLPYGVYYGFCQSGSKLKPALISWGVKPTLTSGKEEALEAHMYDFDENLYGKIIKIVFVKKVRDEKNFGSIKALKEQLEKDYEDFEVWAKISMK